MKGIVWTVLVADVAAISQKKGYVPETSMPMTSTTSKKQANRQHGGESNPNPVGKSEHNSPTPAGLIRPLALAWPALPCFGPYMDLYGGFLKWWYSKKDGL